MGFFNLFKSKKGKPSTKSSQNSTSSNYELENKLFPISRPWGYDPKSVNETILEYQKTIDKLTQSVSKLKEALAKETNDHRKLMQQYKELQIQINFVGCPTTNEIQDEYIQQRFEQQFERVEEEEPIPPTSRESKMSIINNAKRKEDEQNTSKISEGYSFGSQAEEIDETTYSENDGENYRENDEEVYERTNERTYEDDNSQISDSNQATKTSSKKRQIGFKNLGKRDSSNDGEVEIIPGKDNSDEDCDLYGMLVGSGNDNYSGSNGSNSDDFVNQCIELSKNYGNHNGSEYEDSDSNSDNYDNGCEDSDNRYDGYDESDEYDESEEYDDSDEYDDSEEYSDSEECSDDSDEYDDESGDNFNDSDNFSERFGL